MLEKKEEFAIKVGNMVRPFGRPTVISTINSLEYPEVFCEVFLLFEKGLDKCKKYEFQYTFAKELEEMTEFDIDLFRTEVESRIEFSLYDYTNEYFEKHKLSSVNFSNFILSEVDDRQLLGLWLAGDFAEEIKTINDETKCPSLKKAISKLLHLSPMKVTIRRG